MDVRETRYETFEELVVYCRRVAGAVGRVCLAIFGSRAGRRRRRERRDAGRRPRRGAAAHEHPARRARGRRERAGVPARGGPAALRPGRRDPARRAARRGWPALAVGARLGCAGRAPPASSSSCARWCASRPTARQQWFERGMQLVPLLDRRSAACVRAMAGIYHRLLERIEGDPNACCASASRCPRARRRGWPPARWRGRARERGPRGRGRGRPGGDHRGARLRRRGRRGDARGGAPAARRGAPTRCPARASRWTTASTSSCAAAPPTARCWRASAASALVSVQPRLEIPVLRPGARALRAAPRLAAAAAAPRRRARPLPPPAAARAARARRGRRSR